MNFWIWQICLLAMFFKYFYFWLLDIADWERINVTLLPPHHKKSVFQRRWFIQATRNVWPVEYRVHGYKWLKNYNYFIKPLFCFEESFEEDIYLYWVSTIKWNALTDFLDYYFSFDIPPMRHLFKTSLKSFLPKRGL